VLEGGRISMRVRPEVSELSSAGSIQVNGFEVPSLTTRRTETTVELGSGQSFMIGGLLSNGGNNSIERTPFLGNLPILGALFRSNSFRRNETELVIVVTPYLVNPVREPDRASDRRLSRRQHGRAGVPRNPRIWPQRRPAADADHGPAAERGAGLGRHRRGRSAAGAGPAPRSAAARRKAARGADRAGLRRPRLQLLTDR
jgi:Flp pilus assembly secretin CpaC